MVSSSAFMINRIIHGRDTREGGNTDWIAAIARVT